jgi:DNA-binding MarR family transcriptional regulator
VVTRRQALSGELGAAIQRYQRSVQAFDDAVGRRLGLGPADLRCLDWLFDGPKTVGQLATATGLRAAGTTALIDRLTERGFVERVHSEQDRRQVLVRMTEDGMRRAGAMYQPLVQEGQQLVGRLTIHDLEVMRDYLLAITELTERHRSLVAGQKPLA